MDYKVGDIVYWMNDFSDDGEVIKADEDSVIISWNKSGGTQKYGNRFCSDIKVKGQNSNINATGIKILNYDGCTIELAGKKYKLSLVE